MEAVQEMLPKEISTTFHGRDIFAPLAARLAMGMKPRDLGPKKDSPRPDEWRIRHSSSIVLPQIMSVDRFGNVITNICFTNAELRKRPIRALSVGKVMISVFAEHFAAAPENTPCLIAGSSGLLEIIVKNGNAAETLRLNDRSALRILWADQRDTA
jgi:S-adenosylmethionine hydrolase